MLVLKDMFPGLACDTTTLPEINGESHACASAIDP